MRGHYKLLLNRRAGFSELAYFMTNMSWCLVTNNNIFPLLLQGLKTPVVAFTAMLSKDTTIGPFATLKYDHVVTNWGGAYRPTTGIFTAPYDGLYSISCTLMSHPSNYVHLGIMKNGQIISILFSHSNTYPQASQTLHLILNKGDRIWMRNNNNNQNAKITDGKVHNIFSGILIKDL